MKGSRRYARISPRESKALWRSDIDNEAVLAELDKDVEMEAILKFRTGERPAKSARLQALTSGGSCSFNSGTDEVTLASTYDTSGFDPICHPHPTAPRSKLPRRQPRKIDPSSHPLGPFTFQEQAHAQCLADHIMHVQHAQAAAGAAPFMQHPHSLAQLYSQDPNTPLFACRPSSSAQQQYHHQAQKNGQLPPGYAMQQMVLIQGPYGYQAVPAAAFAATPQGAMQLQRLQAQMQATAAAAGHPAGHMHAQPAVAVPRTVVTGAPVAGVPVTTPTPPSESGAAAPPHSHASTEAAGANTANMHVPATSAAVATAGLPAVVTGEPATAADVVATGTPAVLTVATNTANADTPVHAAPVLSEAAVVAGTPVGSVPAAMNPPVSTGVVQQDPTVVGTATGMPVGVPGAMMPGMLPGGFCGVQRSVPVVEMVDNRMVALGSAAGKRSGESRVLQPIQQRQASAAPSPNLPEGSKRKTVGGRKASRPQRATA